VFGGEEHHTRREGSLEALFIAEELTPEGVEFDSALHSHPVTLH